RARSASARSFRSRSSRALSPQTLAISYRPESAPGGALSAMSGFTLDALDERFQVVRRETWGGRIPTSRFGSCYRPVTCWPRTGPDPLVRYLMAEFSLQLNDDQKQLQSWVHEF